MPRKGRELEKLVEAIEKALVDKDAEIKSPAFVEDRVTGETREVDVLLKIGSGHHEQIIAFECKDWNKKVGTPEIEAFRTKTNDLKINKAIIVSSSGFSEPAIIKAKFYNIQCLTLEEIKELDWIAFKNMYLYRKRINNIGWTVDLSLEYLNTKHKDKLKKTKSYKVIQISTGEEFDEKSRIHNAQKYLDNIADNNIIPNQVYRHKVRFPADDFTLIADDIHYNIANLYLLIEFIIEEEIIPMKLIKYQNTTDENTITNIASAELTVSKDLKGYFMIKENHDGTKQVCFSKSDSVSD